jgi:CBS domain-containing protein
MIPLTESPVIGEEASLLQVLNAIEDGKLGFTLVVNQAKDLKGLISNADIRKSLIRTNGNLNSESISEIMNSKPLVIPETATVNDLLQQIKKYTFPILYLPVVDGNNQAKGILTFVNLIKGEI